MTVHDFKENYNTVGIQKGFGVRRQLRTLSAATHLWTTSSVKGERRLTPNHDKVVAVDVRQK